MTDLEYRVQEANKAYWDDNNPIMSDTEYDNLVNQLKKEQPNSPVLNVIGGVIGKYKHSEPMLSLDKAYTHEEVMKWINSVPDEAHISVEPKFDGLAGKLEHGKLVTRGNGIFGQDISHVMPIVKIIKWNGLPVQRVDNPRKVLGEILIDFDVFEKWFASGKIKQQDGTLYANPRNAVSGIINRKDISDLPKDLLSFMVYSPVIGAPKKKWNITEIDNAIKSAIHVAKKYPIDGVVFTLDPESEDYKQMGATAHHPRGAIAYKFKNVEVVGIVDDVTWQQGREVLTPVLKLQDKVDFGEVKVQFATLHNYEQFMLAGLRKGDNVFIERAGGVIPKFIGLAPMNRSTNEPLKAPTKCPYCGSDVVIDGKDLKCVNDNCWAKIVPRMVYAAKCLRIDGLGPKTCQLLYDSLHIEKLWELLKWNFQERISMLPGFTDYTADLLYKNIRNAVGTVYDWEVLSALGIPQFGPELWKKICLDPNFVWTEQGYGTGYVSCLGPIQRQLLLEACSKYYKDYCEMMIAFKPIRSRIEEYKGKICCTGTGPLPRDQIAKQIENSGYKFTDSMTADVKYLVTNDVNGTSSKMQYARKHNIPIISYERLFELLKV